MSDFDLMFKNARHYNEEGSQVYSDAVTLEKALKAKWRILNQSAGVPRPQKTYLVILLFINLNTSLFSVLCKDFDFYAPHGMIGGIWIGESNTVVSTYTMYRHLQQYCSHP